MLSWIALAALLGLGGWTFGYLFVMALMRLTGDLNRGACREEKPISPVSLARFGHS